MAWRMIAALAAALAAGCSNQAAAPDGNQSAAATPAPANPIQTRYDQTITGQPLSRPPTPFQLLVTQVTYPAGHVIECHKHMWPRYVYLRQGSLRVTIRDTGAVHNFSAGDTVVEAIGQWHQGLVTSREPLMLAAIEQVPPGQDNSTPCPAAAAQ